jgi:hypothetical protein
VRRDDTLQKQKKKQKIRCIIHSSFADLGDGTVPLLSLIECKNWAGANSVNINCKVSITRVRRVNLIC